MAECQAAGKFCFNTACVWVLLIVQLVTVEQGRAVPGRLLQAVLYLAKACIRCLLWFK